MVTNKNTREYPVHVLRENLRQAAVQQTALLGRSVGRLTSYDAQPCTEYRQEVAAQYKAIDQLLYLQQCRCSLERCIASRAVRLRYRWQDGHTTDTLFRRTSPGRVKVQGLVSDASLPAAV